MRKNILILFILISKFVWGQNAITGRVSENADSREFPIFGANVYVSDAKQSVFTDSLGDFSLNVSSWPVKIVASFPGYSNDTVTVNSTSFVNIILKKQVNLKEINVNAKKESVQISTINPVNSQKITQHELLKAACCNLSEAFETNPSVNVAYKDAVTGVKEIQLLGLSGIYVQMLDENIPDMHGLGGIYGLTYVPGPWIESIQLTKGSGSVVNGYESTTGQINIEYKKPLDIEQPRMYFNLFADERGSTEVNVIYKHKFQSNWSTMLFLQGGRMKNEIDRNKDGFMDIPNNSTINLYNRWQYHDNDKLEAQVNLKVLSDEINGGQTSDVKTLQLYTTNVKTKRVEVSGKLGFIYPSKPFKSIGNIYQFSVHDMKSSFGLKTYNARESSVYLQSIYQNILWASNHTYKAGITYRYNLLEQYFPGLPERIERNIPGVFLEYTYSYLDKLTIVTGVREDLQPQSKFVFTPRIHGKYNFTHDFIVRFSAGKSYREPYEIADHLSILASSKQIKFLEKINAERAWNYGVNMTNRFKVADHEITFSTDLYRTNFINQLVVDTYSDTSSISLYNLAGKSYSNSLQATLNIEIFENLNLRLAYKFEDVQADFKGKTEQQPLIARNRALTTLSYNTINDHWKFDFTLGWEGKKKLQNTYSDIESGINNFSPSFTVMNFQVTKVFRRFEIYGGAENLFDYRQQDPIIHPEDPFGNSFDATNIWGPIAGRRIYAGIRFTIK